MEQCFDEDNGEKDVTMPEHQEQFDLYLTMPEAMLVCREAVAELDWKVVSESDRGLVCKEP